jgi:hypothetical protein
LGTHRRELALRCRRRRGRGRRCSDGGRELGCAAGCRGRGRCSGRRSSCGGGFSLLSACPECRLCSLALGPLAPELLGFFGPLAAELGTRLLCVAARGGLPGFCGIRAGIGGGGARGSGVGGRARAGGGVVCCRALAPCPLLLLSEFSGRGLRSSLSPRRAQPQPASLRGRGGSVGAGPPRG